MARPMLYDNDGAHPDEARVAFTRDDAEGPDMAECETCGELFFPDNGDCECSECQQAGMLAYRREHDSGAER